MAGEKKGLKVLLVFPPYYLPVYNYPALPILAAELAKDGHNVREMALHLELFEYYLRPDYLRKCAEKIRGGKDNGFSDEEFVRIAASVSSALAGMKREIASYEDFEKYVQDKRVITRALELISAAAYPGEEIRLERNSALSYSSSDEQARKGIIDAVSNRERSIYYDFFEGYALPRIEAEAPAIVGVSISDKKQLIPAMVLCSMIKERLGDRTRIVVGGNLITRVWEEISKDDEMGMKLFSFIDAAIRFEGETALREYAQRVAGGMGFDRVPYLTYVKDGHVVVNKEEGVVDVNVLATPVYPKRNLEMQWNSKKTASLVAGRRCPFNCLFCDIFWSWGGKKYRKRDVELVVDDIEKLMRENEIGIISFGDEYMPARYMLGIARGIKKRGLDVVWECYARMEKEFESGEFCRELYAGGCRFIQFGLESVSEDVREDMNKGKVADPEMVLKAISKAGIMNHVFIMAGYPTETIATAMGILPFLEKVGKHITTIKASFFKLSKFSGIALSDSVREELGISLKENEKDLAPNSSFASVSGKKIGQAFSKVLDLWVRTRHDVNPITRELMYVQRLSVGKERIGEWARRWGKEHVEPGPSADEMKALRKVYNRLCMELKDSPEFKMSFPDGFSRVGDAVRAAKFIQKNKLAEKAKRVIVKSGKEKQKKKAVGNRDKKKIAQELMAVKAHARDPMLSEMIKRGNLARLKNARYSGKDGKVKNRAIGLLKKLS